MPIKGDAKKVLKSMKDQYGDEEGERVFYATANKQKRKPETWEKKAVFSAVEYLEQKQALAIDPNKINLQGAHKVYHDDDTEMAGPPAFVSARGEYDGRPTTMGYQGDRHRWGGGNPWYPMPDELAPVEGSKEAPESRYDRDSLVADFGHTIDEVDRARLGQRTRGMGLSGAILGGLGGAALGSLGLDVDAGGPIVDLATSGGVPGGLIGGAAGAGTGHVIGTGAGLLSARHSLKHNPVEAMGVTLPDQSLQLQGGVGDKRIEMTLPGKAAELESWATEHLHRTRGT